MQYDELPCRSVNRHSKKCVAGIWGRILYDLNMKDIIRIDRKIVPFA